MALTTPNEGTVTKEIEKRTAKLPSGLFLAAGLTALGVSFGLKCANKNGWALFVGQLATPALVMGLYNKIVKTSGHD